MFLGSAVGEAISFLGLDDAAGVGEHGEPLIARGGADATAGTQLGERQRGAGSSECGGDALVERAWWRRCRIAPVDDLQGKGGTTLCQLDGGGGHGWRGTMLDRQREIIAVAAEVEVGIAPGMELRGAAQRLTGADAATALLGVMDDEHGNVMPALPLAQVGEEGRDFAAGVFVDAVETYERIEDEQARLQSGDGLREGAAGGVPSETGGGGGRTDRG